MIDRLINLVSHLGQWGYLVIFLGTMLECTAFMGFVIPGEALVLFGGFLSAQGMLRVGDLAILVCVGAIAGDTIGYEWGRHFGKAWLLRYGRWFGLQERHLQRADEFFRRHGGKAVFLGRFIALGRTLSPFIAGSSRMPYPRFLFYNALGGILWSMTFVSLGYFLGASWQIVERWTGRASAVVGALVLMLIVLMLLWRWLMRHETALKRPC